MATERPRNTCSRLNSYMETTNCRFVVIVQVIGSPYLCNVQECMAFELLRNSHDRGDYLITTHARIIAMTCTHAALQRSNLVRFL
eukprot:4928435-Amphidinium_carterae.1